MPKGSKLSEETRKKMSAAHAGFRHTEEIKKKLSEINKGKNNPYFGKTHSEETKQKMSESRSGDKNAFFGKTHSKETREKISLAMTGKEPHNKGKPMPEESKEKVKQNRKGKGTGKRNAMNTEIGIRNHRAAISSYEYRCKLVEGLLGGFWYGNIRYYDGPQYCEKWTAELRERVRAFFGYRCLECGTPQNGRKLSVHHVWYNKKSCCDDTPRSLVPLCQNHHSVTTAGDHAYWSRHFQDIIDNEYGGRCWLTKEEYALLIKQ